MAKSTRRPSRLVRRHLERVSGRLLEVYGDLLRGSIPRLKGIYALYKGQRLYYVGLASNLPRRLATHLRDRHKGKWNTFSVYETTGDHHIRELESLVLRITFPRGNEVKGKLAGSTDLRRSIKAKIRERHAEEIARIFDEGKRARRPSKRVAPQQPTSKNPLAGVVERRVMHLRFERRGTVHKALLRRDGRIRFKGDLFDSPSLAAARAAGKKAYNGWKAWKYKNAAGEWRFIDELRRKK